jgi:hypothetical protein
VVGDCRTSLFGFDGFGDRFAALAVTRLVFFDLDRFAETFRAGFDFLRFAVFFDRTFFFFDLAITQKAAFSWAPAKMEA